jgi:hypothetical protein
MDRRLFLGSIIGLALMSTAARAQSEQPAVASFDPDPALVEVAMVVVRDVSVRSDDRSLLTQLDVRPFVVAAAEFMAARFDAAGHPVICVDQSRARDLGLAESSKLYVSFRIDVSSVRVGEDPAVVVGTVSASYQRYQHEELHRQSWEPMTHFVVEGDRAALPERAKQALFDQVQKSIVDQIVYLKKRGF